MERVTARQAAHHYFRAAVKEAGSVAALLEKLEAELPDLGRELRDRDRRDTVVGTAQKWSSGQNPPPAEVLIAICRVLGLSLDDAAGATELQPTLEKRLAEVERIAHQLLTDYGELRREVGLPMHHLRDRQETDIEQDPSPVEVVPSSDS